MRFVNQRAVKKPTQIKNDRANNLQRSRRTLGRKESSRRLIHSDNLSQLRPRSVTVCEYQVSRFLSLASFIHISLIPAPRLPPASLPEHRLIFDPGRPRPTGRGANSCSHSEVRCDPMDRRGRASPELQGGGRATPQCPWERQQTSSPA